MASPVWLVGCPTLFASEAELTTDPQRLMAALDAVNQRWGKHTMKLGSNRLAQAQTPSPKGWVMKQERRTPRYTTQWEEMPLVRA
jgi:DNA polymerase V